MTRRPLLQTCAVVALVATTFGTQAQESPQSVALVAKAGFLTGVGLDVSVPVAENINLRAGGSGWKYDRDFTEGGIDYRGDLRLRTAGVYVDWYPTYGIFRVSAGLVRNSSRFALNGRPSPGQTVTIGDTTYDATQVGSVDGAVVFDRDPAPFIGVGFGNPSARGRWGFVGEIGWIRQKTPQATLTATCGAALSPAQCVDLQADAAAEQAELQDAVKDWRWYPALSVGLSFRF